MSVPPAMNPRVSRSRFGAYARPVILGSALGCAACQGLLGVDFDDARIAGDASTATLYTLDNACDAIVPKLCDSIASCCEKTGGFDQAGCLAHAKADCAKDVADVRSGHATFHPERVDPCFVASAPLFDSCYATDDLALRVAALRDCRTFEGQLADGAACERDSQCSPSAGDLVACANGRCTPTTILAEGAPCAFDDGLKGLCASELYCDATGTRTCKRSTPVGSTCDEKAAPSIECGLGRYCDPATALCTNGRAGGASCDDLTECASLVCAPATTTESAKSCALPKGLVTTEECKGP